MSVFNENQIRQAIENFQRTHPVSYAFDIHHIKDEESLSILKRTINDLCEKAERDSEMHIIMEMAKAYLDGANPTIDRKQGRWEDVGEQMILNLENAREQYSALGYPHRNILKLQCSSCRKVTMVDSSIQYDFCPHCGVKMTDD